MDIWHSQLNVARKVLPTITSIRTRCWPSASPTSAKPRGVGPQDRRADRASHRLAGPPHGRLCDAARRRQGKKITDISGLELDAYFSATKLKWLLDNVPGARAGRAGRLAFGTVDSWLVYKLTGQHVTDVSNAARTMLFNIHLMRWDYDLLHLFGIPEAVLPQVVSSSEEVGNTHPACLARRFRWPASPATSRPRPSARRATAGHGQEYLRHRLLHADAPGPPSGGLAQPPADHGRLARRWRDRLPARRQRLHGRRDRAVAARWLGIIRRRPKWKSWRPACRIAAACSWCRPCRPGRAALGCLRARLAVWPEPRQHARPHRPRRAGSHRLPERRADGGDAERCFDPLTEVRADGGAARNDLLMQFQADVLGVPVVRPLVTETTALGAAYLAGLAVGFWDTQEEIAAQWRCDRRFEPAMRRRPARRPVIYLARAVERSKSWTD
jgi:glycerol kinase